MNAWIISNHIKNWQSPIITNTYWTYQTYPLAVSCSIHSSIQEIRPCASPEVEILGQLEYLNASTSEFSCWFMSWVILPMDLVVWFFPVKYGLQFLSSMWVVLFHLRWYCCFRQSRQFWSPASNTAIATGHLNSFVMQDSKKKTDFFPRCWCAKNRLRVFNYGKKHRNVLLVRPGDTIC